MLHDEVFLDKLRMEKYTVGMAENYDICAWAVFHSLGIKVVHELNAMVFSENSHVPHGIPFDFRHIPGN